MLARVKGLADCRHGTDLQLAQNLFHLLHDQGHAGAKLLLGSSGLECQLEVVHHGQKLLYNASRRVIAKLDPLPLGSFAGIFKLGLQARQAIEQLVALGLQLIEFLPAHGLGSWSFAALLRRLDGFFLRCCFSGFNTVNSVSSFGISLRALRNIILP